MFLPGRLFGRNEQDSLRKENGHRPGRLGARSHSKTLTIVSISKPPTSSEELSNQDLPNVLSLTQPKPSSLYPTCPAQPCGVSLPAWSLPATHLGQLVLGQDGPSLLVLGLSDKDTSVSRASGRGGHPLVLPPLKRRLSSPALLRERGEDVEWTDACRSIGEAGETAGGFGGADIPVYRKPETLRARVPGKPAPDGRGAVGGGQSSAPQRRQLPADRTWLRARLRPSPRRASSWRWRRLPPRGGASRRGPAGHPAAGTPGVHFPGSAARSPTRKRRPYVISARRKLRADFLPRGADFPAPRPPPLFPGGRHGLRVRPALPTRGAASDSPLPVTAPPRPPRAPCPRPPPWFLGNAGCRRSTERSPF